MHTQANHQSTLSSHLKTNTKNLAVLYIPSVFQAIQSMTLCILHWSIIKGLQFDIFNEDDNQIWQDLHTWFYYLMAQGRRTCLHWVTLFSGIKSSNC